MTIRKAVITAAAPSQRSLPLQSVVDSDGNRKSVLQVLVEQARAAGAEEVAVVVYPGDEGACQGALENSDGVVFVAQSAPRGYGHAVWSARGFVGDAPFLHQVGDHVFLSASHVGCGAQLAEIARREGCSVAGVQPTRETLLPYFGAIGGQRVKGTHDLFTIERVAEKPTPTVAEQELIVPGLRAGHYLCFVGTHILSATAMELLDRHVHTAAADGSIQLSPVLNELALRERFLAVETPGRRYPLDTRYGLLYAQLALAMAGPDREAILTGLCDLLATRDLMSAKK